MKARILAFVVVVVLAGASRAGAQSIGIYMDAGGTNCNLSAPNVTWVTWYVVYHPAPGDAGLQSVDFYAPLPTNQYFTQSVSNPIASSANGNPCVQTGQMTFICPGPATNPIVLYTLSVINFANAPPATVRYSAFVRRCDGSTWGVSSGSSVVNFTGDVVAAASPSPPDQQTSVLASTNLQWAGSQVSHPCLSFSIVADVYLGTDPNPTFYRRISGTEIYAQGLAHDTTYYWRVDTVRLPEDVHVSSPVWSFRTRPYPEVPPGCPTTCSDASACPSACMTLDGDFFCVSSSAAVQTVYHACEHSEYPGSAQGWIDRSRGYAQAFVAACPLQSEMVASVAVVDRFQIVGPPSATPLNLIAKLWCDGSGTACLRQGDAEVCGRVPFVQLPLQHTVGEEFELEYKTTAYSFEGQFETIILSFDGLSDDYLVVSCHGYQSRLVVRPTSWSNLKSMYR
jgi:hypothetical protein